MDQAPVMPGVCRTHDASVRPLHGARPAWAVRKQRPTRPGWLLATKRSAELAE